MRLRTKRGFCVKCGTITLLTRHHLYPKRFFGLNESTILICRDCHDEIETILPRDRKLSKKEYLKIHKKWLKDEEILIIE